MKVRHILGISGGKDSAALAIYMKDKYPDLKIEYYNSDTGCELEETEILIDRLESYLGGITRLRAAAGSTEPTPFEHFLKRTIQLSILMPQKYELIFYLHFQIKNSMTCLKTKRNCFLTNQFQISPCLYKGLYNVLKTK